ncbi:MAG TPA: tetratricopeptide repeat protein [Bryobacteraceae bacterium]|nr:tetratricopeptide repeat protein [Bryobacteraceae bacterium]
MRYASLIAVVALCALSAACIHSASYYLQKGNNFLAAGKYDEASLNYRKAIQKDSHSAEAYLRLGIAETNLKHFPAAWENLNRALDLAPQRDDIRVQLGDFCVAGFIIDRSRPANLYNRLKELSGQLLAKDPNSFDGLRFRGYLAAFDHRMDQAIDDLGRAHRMKPSEPLVASTLAQALFASNKGQEAEQIAQELIRLNPSYPLIYDELSSRYLAQGRTSDAASILKLKIANNPRQPRYAIRLADFYWRLGRQAEALDTIAKMLSQGDDQPARHLAAGDFYGAVERWQDATRQFEEGMRLAPSQKLLFEKRIADTLLAQDKRTEAAALVDEILKQQPQDEEARRIRAGLKLKSNDPQAIASAVSEYQALLREKSDDPVLHYDLALAFVAKGDPAAARSEFQEAIRRQPSYLLPRTALAELALKAGRPDESLRWCDEAIAIDPLDNRSRLLKATALENLGKYDQARNVLNAVLQSVPDNLEALLQLSLLEINRHDYKAAEAALARLQRISPADAARGTAAMLAAEGQVDKAIDLLRRVLVSDQALLHNLVGGLALQGRKYDVAIREFQALAASNSHSAEPYMQLAEAYRLRGDWSNSIATLERAQKALPGDAGLTLLLASSFEATGKLDLAIEQYRRALKLRPEDPGIMNNIAYLSVETKGDLDEALRLAQRAVQKAPNQPNFADTLGWVYLNKKMADSALQVFHNLAKKQPDDPTFQYHLGAALFEKGDKTQARAVLQAALSKNPSQQQAVKIRELLAKIG